MTNLDRKVATATRWSLVNTIVIRIGTFATGVVLARYFLGPEQWGLYAVGLVVLAVLLSANEMGVSLAMIRWEGDVRRFAPTVLTLSTVSSTVLYAVVYVSAPHLATLLGSAEATTLLRVLCLCVVIDGAACVPVGVLTREFRQRQRMVVDFANFAVSTTVTMVLAVMGAGALSFAWGAVAGNLVATVGFALFAPGMLRFGWDSEQARKLIRFGLPLAGASLLVLAMLNVDSAIVGAVLGPAALGLYQIAFNVSSWPVRLVSEAARRVSFAGFSRLAETPALLTAGFRRGLGLLLAAAVPACVLLGVLAEPLIRLVYGDRWTPAAGALRFLVVLGLLRVVYELSYDCLVAVGQRKTLLMVQGWWLVTLVPVLLYLARTHGIAGVGLGHVLVAGVLVLPAFVVALRRAGIPTRAVAQAAARPVLGGVAMGAVCWATVNLVGDGVVGLGLAGIASVAVYAPFVLPLVRKPRPAPGPLPVPQFVAETSGDAESVESR